MEFNCSCFLSRSLLLSKMKVSRRKHKHSLNVRCSAVWLLSSQAIFCQMEMMKFLTRCPWINAQRSYVSKLYKNKAKVLDFEMWKLIIDQQGLLRHQRVLHPNTGLSYWVGLSDAPHWHFLHDLWSLKFKSATGASSMWCDVMGGISNLLCQTAFTNPRTEHNPRYPWWPQRKIQKV